MNIRAAAAMFVAVSVTFGTGRSSAQSSNDNRICSRTSDAARTACREDVTVNYQLAVGRCLNTADATDRQSCLADAKSSQADDTQLCSQQFDARTSVCASLGEAPYDPPFEPGDFVDPLQIGKGVTPNRFFPLIPGSEWVYQSSLQTNTVDVLGKVDLIDGVPCTRVHDVVVQNGQTTEDTIDWFAQKTDGSVWYCGESSEELQDGRVVDISGSWRAGVDEARPGIIMEANPRVGDTYRQEFLLGEAEDVATVTSITASVAVQAASCEATCVVTAETSPLEPGAHEDKYYAPNIGLILDIDRVTGERLQLIRIRIP